METDAKSRGSVGLPPFLSDGGLQLLLFGGKGGVGKTTCAAAAGLRRAACLPSRSLLLVSTDPAHSLRDSLNGTIPPGNLTVLELDAQKSLVDFRQKHAEKLRRIAAAGTFLDDCDINQLLDLSLPGLDELMAFVEISDWVEGRRYDCIIVDTAPSGHALRLLAMPRLLRNWISVLDAMLAKRRYMRKVLVGVSGPDELDRFLSEWWSSLDRMKRLLRNPARSQFIPVTIAESLSVAETMAVLAHLRRDHIPVSDVIINQLHPPGGCPTCRGARARELSEAALLHSHDPSLQIWTIDLSAEEVRGVGPLRAFWDRARPMEDFAPDLDAPQPPHTTGVHEPAILVNRGIRLLLFAGKGGVGKTTLSCATAIRLATDFPDKRILLISTDPAHSLSDCLQTPVRGKPAPLLAGLSAMTIDAQCEFETFKSRYADDIREFFDSISATLDFTYDRVVVEKLMDLAPPGLDEVMALAGTVDLLNRDEYDIFVVDSAATGHFLRLMELPAMVEAWLKTIFRVLLKYEQVLHLSRLSGQLVRLSKNIKQFRRLLGDPERAAVYTVSIPTQMAWEETKDLLEACSRMGIFAPAIFLNLMTPPVTCSFCAGRRQVEADVAAKFRESFPWRQHVLVYRQGELTGLDRLCRLSQELFQTRERSSAVQVGS